MKKIAMTLSAATLLVSSLVGCGATDDEARGLDTNQRGFGYHTTQEERDTDAGEGPITDMFTRDDDRTGYQGLGRNGRHPATGLAGQRGMTMDNPIPQGMPTRHREMARRNAGVTGQQGRVTGDQYQGFGTNNGMMDGSRRNTGFIGSAREGIVRGDNGMIHPSENNVNGLNRTGRTTGYSYPTGYDTATVNRLNTRLGEMKNIKDSRVLVHDDTVVIGVEADERQTEEIKRNIKGVAGDREVIVVTERDQIEQVRSMDDRLRAGEPLEEIGATFTDMVNDFGRALSRPFERSR